MNPLRIPAELLRRGSLLCAVAVCLTGRFPLPLFAQNPTDDDIRREQVLAAITRGQQALLRMQNSDGSWNSLAGFDYGPTGLATLALLSSGLPPQHPAIQKSLRWMIRSENDPVRTYDMAMVIMALSASGERAVLGKIARLAARLEENQNTGAGGGNWSYQEANGSWDNSNTQMAILGLREAVQAGVIVDREVWQRAQDHFLRTQQGGVNTPGGAFWTYVMGDGPRGSMTVAGIASLAITSAMLQDDSNVSSDGRIDCCGERNRDAEQAIQAGVTWLTRNFQIMSNPGYDHWVLYYLYGLERAGRFTGRRFFGDHDWYREGADFLVRGQDLRQGTWQNHGTEQDPLVGTSFALLFLSKGLSPVVVNKLKYGQRDASGEVIGQDWDQHPRDITNLIDYISTIPQWPPLLTWQIVDLRAAAQGEGVAALLQAPVQYLGGTERLEAIQGRELELLRSYLEEGGFLFAVQNCDSPDFHEGIHDLVRRLFDGQYPLTKLPPTHDIYRSEIVFSPDGNVPELWGVDFGCRTAIVYAPFDHACRWEKWSRQPPPQRPVPVTTQISKSMNIGVNVIAYATGRELQDKLQRPQVMAVVPHDPADRSRLSIARLRHSGGWDTAPHALRRLQQGLETVNVESSGEAPSLSAADPALKEFPIVYMHGRKNFQLSDEEQAALKRYLEDGGFLFADACCGAAQFDGSFRRMIEQMFGRPLERIPIENELYNLPVGHDIRRVQRRIPSTNPRTSGLAVQESVGEPVLEGIQLDGRWVIVYSKYDLSCALERQATTACAGYPTEAAVKIAANIVLYGLLQ